jgi:hypothetical protein
LLHSLMISITNGLEVLSMSRMLKSKKNSSSSKMDALSGW